MTWIYDYLLLFLLGKLGKQNETFQRNPELKIKKGRKNE
jgi:hypothetical protein